MSWVWRFALLVVLVLAPAAAVQAHTKSETNSAWQIAGSGVRMTFTAPDIEVRRIPTPNGGVASDAELGGYLTRHIRVDALGARCPLVGPPHALSASPGYRRMEFQFQCRSAKGLRLHSDAFIDLVPTHVNFAQVQPDQGDFIEQMFDQTHQDLDLGGGPAEHRLQDASFFEYVRLGIMHIFTGVDHMSFLVGLVMISRRLRDLTFVITGFTLGHSVTLALAVTGVIRPHAEYIDALVALTIALIGAENIVVATRRPAIVAGAVAGLLLAMALGRLLGLGGLPTLLLLGSGLFAANYLMVSGHLQDAGRLRLLVTLVFGLIHGFGFASDLLQMKLPPTRLAELLVGFNLGVEIGQLTLVLAVAGSIALLGRLKLALPRPIVVDVASSFLVALGLYWFVSRSYA